MNKRYIQLANFLENNKILINQNKFKQVYDKLVTEISFDYRPKFTDVLLKAGINPLLDQSFKEVPAIFAYRLNIESFTIPDNIVEINGDAFCNCKKLKNIYFSNNLTHIYTSAFSGCSSLEELNLPNSLNSIGEYAFQHCTSLKKINIPQSLPILMHKTFYDCSSLETIEFPSSFIGLHGRVFQGCTNLKTIIFNNKYIVIDGSAFSGCNNIQSIIYNGTKEEWDVGNNSLRLKSSSSKNIVVKCTDEVFHI